MVSQAVDRTLLSATKVEHGAVTCRVVERAAPCINDVVDVDEVARLLTVSENRNRLSALRVSDKNAQNALVWVVDRLPRTVHVVHTEARHIERKVQIGTCCRDAHV